MRRTLTTRGLRRGSAGSAGPPVVVLGGLASALAVTRAVGREGVPVVSVCQSEHDYLPASRYVTRRIAAPDPERDTEAYIELLQQIGSEHPGSLLVPSADDALTAVGRHKEVLSEHFAVGCMEWELLRRCLDKKETQEIAEREGIPVPRSLSPVSFEELEARSEDLVFPCLVKPRLSHLYSRAEGRKMDKVDTREELLRSWREAREAGHEVLVQEFIPGPDHNGANYNAYLAGGEVWAECTAHKVRSRQPEIASPRLVLSREIPEVAELGRRVTRAVGVHGFANVEFKRHARTGVFYLIEVNARHNMSAALAVRCGLNFPMIEYRHRIHGERPEPVTAETGVYWIGLEWELRQGLRLAARGQLPRTYLRPYVRPHIYDVLDWRDPAPFAKWAKDMVRGTVTRRHAAGD